MTQLLAKFDESQVASMIKQLDKQIREETPTQPQISHTQTRRAIRLINDKTGTHRALQQMKMGEYALFTDGSYTNTLHVTLRERRMVPIY